ncbi:hypothetical protein LEMLEM_LOCUS21714, partial [Lemmus lemmus]
MYRLLGSLVCLVAHLPGLGWRGEDLRLPTGQSTLTSPGTGEEWGCLSETRSHVSLITAP